MGKKVVRYSEAFKLKIVSELESGKLSSMAEARRKYGIGGGSTVANWLNPHISQTSNVDYPKANFNKR